MNKNEYKTTSFLANVSDDEIISILTKCGYRLYYNIFNETDGQRKPIERIYNPKTKKEYLEISCKNIALETMTKKFFDMTGLSTFVSKNIYDISLVFVSDYVITDLRLDYTNDTASNNLQNEYAKFMYDKFGEQYRVLYNKYHTKRNKIIDRENEKN